MAVLKFSIQTRGALVGIVAMDANCFGGSAVTDLRGRGNKLGVAQNADNAYLDFSMEGSNNRGAIYQNRDGSRFSANVVGRNNTVIYRDN